MRSAEVLFDLICDRTGSPLLNARLIIIVVVAEKPAALTSISIWIFRLPRLLQL